MPRKRIGRELTVPVTFRIEPSRWEELGKKAKQENRSVADLARVAIYQYLERNPVNVDKADIAFEERMRLVWEHAEKAHKDGRPLNPGYCEVCDYYLG